MDEKEAEARPVMGTIFLVILLLYSSFFLKYHFTSSNYPMDTCIGGTIDSRLKVAL